MSEEWEQEVIARMAQAKADLGMPANAPSDPRYPQMSQRGRKPSYARRGGFGAALIALLLSLVSGSISPARWVQNEATAFQLCSDTTNHDGLAGCVGGMFSRHATPAPTAVAVRGNGIPSPQPSASGVPTSPPATSAPALPLLFVDGFDGEVVGAPPRGWTVTDAWKIAARGSNGYVQVVGPESGQMNAGSSTWTNVSATALLRRDVAQSGVHLALRYRDAKNFYACGVDFSGRTDMTIAVNGNESHIGLNGPVKTVLRETGPIQPIGAWITVRFVVVGNQLSCTIPGAGTITVTDSTFASGAVGLTTFGPGSADDVSVSTH